MRIALHPIGFACGLKRLNHLSRCHANIKINRLGGLKKPLNMQIHKRPAPMIKPQTFPNAIPHQKPGIINRNQRLCLGFQIPIHINQKIIIARIMLGFMGGLMCGLIHLTAFLSDHRIKSNPSQESTLGTKFGR